ncbi:MAG: hypothetical protein AAGA69_04860, partial [Pseudomonadota bacterium]
VWAGLILLGKPVLGFVFGRTELGPEGVDAVWHALVWLSPLVPIRFCLQPVMQFVFARTALSVAFAAGFGGTLVTLLAFFVLNGFLPTLISAAAMSVVIGQLFQVLLPLAWVVTRGTRADDGGDETMAKGETA